MLHTLATVMTSATVAVTASHVSTTHEPQSQQAATRQAAQQPAEQAATRTATPQKATPKQSTAQQASRTPARPQFAFHEIETKLISATNQARAQYGLPPLQVDYALMSSARRHTAWMTRARRLQHTSAMVAENIAMGQPSVRGAISSWLSSPGHRANMLNGSYRRLGVAAYRTPEGTIYWCQQFSW